MEAEAGAQRAERTMAMDLVGSARRVVAWIRDRMMPSQDGSRGVWERVIIDEGRIQYWVRSDCTAETAQLLLRVAEAADPSDLRSVARNLLRRLASTQQPAGSFPFFERIVPKGQTSPGAETGDGVWPNDNGKVLEILAETADCVAGLRLDAAAERLGDYFAANQTDQGWWNLNGVAYPGTCFVVWPLVGLSSLWSRTGCGRYRDSALRALAYLRSLQLPTGRFRTSYEISRVENWRPVSSESVMALKALSVAQVALGEDFRREIDACGAYVLSLAAECGAIRNCDDTCLSASEQNDPDLTDLVYTDGYALHALLDAHRATGDASFREGAVELARFLASIQCQGESPLWDGAWRGSYDLVRGEWRGRADHGNPLDEGGMYSAYTGWCAAPIGTGMVRVASGE